MTATARARSARRPARAAIAKTAKPAKPAKRAAWLFAQLDEVPATRCPCGWSRRAFAQADNQVATLHRVEITEDARTHYHKRMTEIYLVLEGTGHIELDGELVPVRPMSAVMVRPGCRHRAIGKLTIINVPVPAFDPADEWFDEARRAGA